MKYRFVYVKFFLLTIQSLCLFPGLSSSALPAHEKAEFSRMEIELIEDLALGNENKRNFIFFGYKLDFACSSFTCEKYSITNLGLHLSIRGERIYNKKNIDDHYAYLHNSRVKNAGSSHRNIIILKFLSFSDEDIIVLDQIRAYNMKSFFVVFAEDDETFSNLRSHILKSELFNIYVIRRSSNSQVYLAYEVCAYCAQGKSELRFYKGWQQNRGFNTPITFSSSFKGSFFGAEIKVGTIIYPPVIFPIGISKEGKPIYRGQEYLFLVTLAKSLNFTLKLVVPNDRKSCSYDKKNNSWLGYCKTLEKREVDLAGFPVGIDYGNFHVADPTGVYRINSNRLISVKPAVKKEVKIKGNQSLLIMMLVLCIIFISLMIVNKHIQGGHNLNSYFLAAFHIISILFLEAIRFRNLHQGYLIILGLWILCCFFIIFNFFGQMTSIAVIKKPVTGYINTMEDMKEKNVSWILHPSYKFIIYEVLERKLPEQAKYKITMSVEEGLKVMLQNSSNHVYVAPKEGLNAMIRHKFWDGKGENPFHFSPPLLGDKPFFITPLVRKDAPYTREVTKKILQLDAAGLYNDKYIPDTFDLLGQLGKPKPLQSKKGQQKHRKISLKTISVYLYACLFILFIATVVFVIEVSSLLVVTRIIINIMSNRRRRAVTRKKEFLLTRKIITLQPRRLR